MKTQNKKVTYIKEKTEVKVLRKRLITLAAIFNYEVDFFLKQD